MDKHTEAFKNELIDVFYTNNRLGWVGSLVLWLGILFAYDFPNQIATYIFSGLVLLFSFLHILNSHQYSNQKMENLKPSKYWLQTASLISAFQGITISLTPWFLLDVNDPAKVYLITTLLIAPMFGSAIISATARTVHLSWCLASSLPLIIFLLLSEQREYQIMATMILVTGIPVAILINIYVYKLFSQMIELKYKNLDLLSNVQQQQIIAEKESSEKSRFIAATSHDLRQPLHALNLYLEALEIKLIHTDSSELLNKAQQSSKTLNELLNALMDISRLDAGIVTAKPSLNNIKDLIESIIVDLKPLVEKKNINLSYHLETAIVSTDPVLFSRVIRNLAINAIQHNDHCDINITMETSDNDVIIKVSDTGRGLTSTELDKIFSEFYQLNNPERDRNKGLGLGLAIVKKLTTLLNIPLSVESKLGETTCFSLIMPLSHHSYSPIFPRHQQHEIDLTGQFIMVIDDDEMVCDALKTLLKSWSCEVLLASSEEQLINEIQQHFYPAPELIICDYQLRDGKNGVQVIHAVRTHYACNIPALIISADTSDALKQEINELSCELLYKPLKSHELRMILESLHQK